jgi:hypothetical protein
LDACDASADYQGSLRDWLLPGLEWLVLAHPLHGSPDKIHCLLGGIADVRMHPRAVFPHIGDLEVVWVQAD